VTSAARAVIAVMAKAPRPGRVKTRLSPALSRVAAARLARALLLDTLDTVRQVRGVHRVVLYAPRRSRASFRQLAGDFEPIAQRAGDLGRRLALAFRDLHALGRGPVVVIGGDAPALPAAVLTRAIRVLADGRHGAVLGPSADGGYYLIGSRRPCAALFRGIAWSSPAVFSQTLARARRQRLAVAVLPRWWDVDTPADVERLRRWLAAHPTRLPHTRRCLRALGVTPARRHSVRDATR
jgi:rSAM/selenodomain-associated transferase 1